MAESDNPPRTPRPRPPSQTGKQRALADSLEEPATVIHRPGDLPLPAPAEPPLEKTVVSRGPAPREKDTLTGMKLGEYEVLELVARGGMGLVYKGRHPLIGKQVAIKVLLPHVAQDKVQVQRLVEEARIVNAIRHPNIVDIFSLGQLSDGRSYLVMEFLEGEPLGEILKRRGRITVDETLTVLEQTLAALQAAHEAGAVHRDLKPGNLFITPLKDGKWRVKVVDFGIAKVAGARASTAPDTVLGTPGYMAPEQIRCEGVVPATDLYAMGACAYRMLSGKDPFTSNSLVELLDLHLDAPVPPLETGNEKVPPELEALIFQLLEKEAADRPASAEAARQVVAEIIQARERASAKPKPKANPSGVAKRPQPVAPAAPVEDTVTKPTPAAKPKIPPVWIAVAGLGAALLLALGYIALR